jgi:hypothetical protein
MSPLDLCERASKESSKESGQRESDFFECERNYDDFEDKSHSSSEGTIQDATGATNNNTVKEGKREVTYTAYAENIEACVKLLSCYKTAVMIEKDDVKKTRMFVTSTATFQE